MQQATSDGLLMAASNAINALEVGFDTTTSEFSGPVVF